MAKNESLLAPAVLRARARATHVDNWWVLFCSDGVTAGGRAHAGRCASRDAARGSALLLRSGIASRSASKTKKRTASFENEPSTSAERPARSAGALGAHETASLYERDMRARATGSYVDVSESSPGIGERAGASRAEPRLLVARVPVDELVIVQLRRIVSAQNKVDTREMARTVGYSSQIAAW
jgi:hypothetical protein